MSLGLRLTQNSFVFSDASLGYGKLILQSSFCGLAIRILTLLCLLSVEYIVVAHHRQSWYEWGALMLSKAQLMHFGMELAKKLDIWYKSPPLPVDLTLTKSSLPDDLLSPVLRAAAHDRADSTSTAPDLSSLQDLFAPKYDKPKTP